jgi:two-component system chemotaxis response regulator CheY
MKTVLVVDDSALIQFVLKTALELGGLQVETAGDGEEAMGKLKNGMKPDLIVTDLNMPNMDGLEFIKNARTVLRFTPILMVTTESQVEKRDEAKRLGASGWLTKPVNPIHLMTVVQRLLPGM